MSMLSLAGMRGRRSTPHGPITDNSRRASPEMARWATRSASEPTRSTPSATPPKAGHQGYAIASAGLAAVVLFATYIQDLRALAGVETGFDLSSTSVLAVFSSARWCVSVRLAGDGSGGVAGGKSSKKCGASSADPGPDRKAPAADYRPAWDIVTATALRLMIAPALIPVVVPLLVGSCSARRRLRAPADRARSCRPLVRSSR